MDRLKRNSIICRVALSSKYRHLHKNQIVWNKSAIANRVCLLEERQWQTLFRKSQRSLSFHQTTPLNRYQYRKIKRFHAWVPNLIQVDWKEIKWAQVLNNSEAVTFDRPDKVKKVIDNFKRQMIQDHRFIQKQSVSHYIRQFMSNKLTQWIINLLDGLYQLSKSKEVQS